MADPQQPTAPLLDYDALAGAVKKGTIPQDAFDRDIWSRMTDEQRQGFVSAMGKGSLLEGHLHPYQGPGGLPGGGAEPYAIGALGAASGLAGGLPDLSAVGGAAKAGAQAAKGFAGAHPYVTGAAGMTALQYAPLPAPMKNALESMFGLKMMMHGVGPGLATEGVKEATAPGPANLLRGGIEESPALLPDRGVNVIPRNMSTTRTPADVGEQVGRGVTNDFRGVAHIDPNAGAPSISDVSRVKPNTPGGGFSDFNRPGPYPFGPRNFEAGPSGSGKLPKLQGSDSGASSLDQLLSGIHGPDVDLPPNGGVSRATGRPNAFPGIDPADVVKQAGSGGGFDPREIPPGVTRKSPPPKFKAAGEKFAVGQEDPSETARMQAMIKSLLDRQRD